MKPYNLVNKKKIIWVYIRERKLGIKLGCSSEQRGEATYLNSTHYVVKSVSKMWVMEINFFFMEGAVTIGCSRPSLPCLIFLKDSIAMLKVGHLSTR